VPATRRIAALLATAAVALAPGSALAQNGGGAGDEQYQDPFGGQTPSSPSKKPSPKQQQPTPTAPLGSAPPATAGAPAAAPAQQAAGELPRTGFDVLWLAGIGAVALLAGIGLRRRTADDRR
jgi:LPXTG-motif cell wall-anchored protein